jgi:hyperosmotically inducible protein
MKRTFQNVAMAAALAVFTVPMFGRSDQPRSLPDAVRHELVMQPYYSIFDDLEYRVDNGGVVTLSGAVTRPILKSDAEHAVKKIPGVSQVINNIKVLPLSPIDNRIRVATYRAIFQSGSMYRYAMGANPSLHIIVENGHVTLKGVVDNEADRAQANIRANGVPGVFSVTNDLRVAER